MDLLRNLPLISPSTLKFTIFTLGAPGALAPSFRQLGIAVHAVHDSSLIKYDGSPGRFGALAYLRDNLKGLGIAAQAFWSIATLYSMLRRARPDAIHCILPRAYFVGGVTSTLLSIPLMMSRVCLNTYQQRTPFLSLIERHFLHRFPKAAVCNCDAIRSELLEEGVDRAKIRVIFNGIKADDYAPDRKRRDRARAELNISDDTFVITNVASLWGYKGHADLLQAVIHASKEFKGRWVLLVAGRDPESQIANFRQIVSANDLAGHVRFLGEHRNVVDLLSASDLHVSSSHEEGFPNNILEAMAASLPIIATNVGGVSEMVKDNETGVLVEPRNPAQIARAMVDLQSDPDRRHIMGEKGRQRALSHFTLERSATAWREAYNELLDI